MSAVESLGELLDLVFHEVHLLVLGVAELDHGGGGLCLFLLFFDVERVSDMDGLVNNGLSLVLHSHSLVNVLLRLSNHLVELIVDVLQNSSLVLLTLGALLDLLDLVSVLLLELFLGFESFFGLGELLLQLTNRYRSGCRGFSWLRCFLGLQLLLLL